MSAPNVTEVKRGISVLWETLQCPICLELLTTPVSTKCDHQFCKFCMLKLLNSTKKNMANCPVCKANVTKRSLQESPGFQRLVAGLQDMIQAYEHDTGTNYFTGMAQQRQSGVTDAEVNKKTHDGSSADTDNLENGDDDPRSPSSTIAAQNGFARVMGFENTSTLTENDGLDSGIGGAQETSEKRVQKANDDPAETEMSQDAEKTISRVVRNTNLETAPVPSLSVDDRESPPQRKSSRKKKKRDLDPEKILGERQKKSVEKVAEWLMNVPMEEDLESVKLTKNTHDSDNSDCASSTSTLDVKLFKSDVNRNREDQAKALEEQVFGAVYKRDRRSSRTTSLAPNVLLSPPAHSLTTEIKTSERNSKQKKNGIISANLMNKFNSTEKELADKKKDRPVRVHDTCLDALTSAKKTDVCEKGNIIPESEILIKKGQDPCLVSETAAQQHEEKTKKQMCNTGLQFDTDLQEQDNSASKKTKNGRGRPEKGKCGRMSKPLVLVGVQNEETVLKGRPPSEEVQIHIENYPSSEDRETPIMTGTRRSRRLQVSADKVSKDRSKPPANLKKTSEESSKQPEETHCEELADVTSSSTEHTTKVAKRNGCVCDTDLEKIEHIDPIERLEETVEGIANAPQAEPPSEAACLASPSKGHATETVGAEPDVDDHNNPLTDDIQLEAGGCDSKNYRSRKEEENNDSEMDTEQLLRSFKAAKRKSFHFGFPGQKGSCGLDERSEQSADIEELSCEDPGAQCAKRQMANTPDITIEGSVKDSDISSCNNLIPPSNSPMLLKETDDKPNQVAVDGSTPDSYSNALSPCRSLVPQAADPVLCCQNVVLPEGGESMDLNESQLYCTRKDSSGARALRFRISPEHLAASGKQYSADTSDCFVNEDASLTPDGLGLPVSILDSQTKANSLVGKEPSIHSIESNPRKRRRIQRLQSTSESDCSESTENLPTLTQIFQTSAPPIVDAGVEGQDIATRCEDECPADCSSPDFIESSQASMDLFGTADEYDVAVNDVSVSIESSQLPADTLNTQQKIEMQKELVRLEKLMALVSEVLEEKERDPSNTVPSEPHQNNKSSVKELHSPLHRSDAGKNPKSTANVSDGGQELAMQLYDDEALTQAISKQSRSAEMMQPPTLPETSGKGAGTFKNSNSSSPAKRLRSCSSPRDGQADKENDIPKRDGSKARIVLVSSGLEPAEQIMVKKFAKRVGAHVISKVTADVTHVIMSTDDQLVCERTLKYFLGIAGRKWVVSFQWISECFKQKKLLDESAFEVRGDVVNGPNHFGPMRARTAGDNNLLMRDLKVCFQGTFADMTTDQIQWMAELCGATVVKDPVLLDSTQKSCQLVIVQSGSQPCLSTCSSLSKKATVVTRGWLLDSVATYTLQSYSNYVIRAEDPAAS